MASNNFPTDIICEFIGDITTNKDTKEGKLDANNDKEERVLTDVRIGELIYIFTYIYIYT